ncbi:MAG: hypothetical protein ACR2RV_29565, partial [Verrucomicrobiales bacterium]
MPTRLVLTSLAQLNSLYIYLGSIIAAPLFFFSLLHPFKRPEISSFRWCILLMWLFAVFGMSIFGLADGARDPNQLHLLFIPLMTAYGLAFLSVLWSRLGITSHMWMILNGHLIIVVLISALPLLLTFFPNVKRGLYIKDMKTPDYTIGLLQKEEIFAKGDVIVTDAPWDVAWYGDRTAVWLPGSLSQFKELEAFAKERKSPVKGLLFTSESLDKPMVSGVIGIGAEYRDWYQPLVYSALLYSNDEVTKRVGGVLLENFDLPYKYLSPTLRGGGIFFFGDERPEDTE